MVNASNNGYSFNPCPEKPPLDLRDRRTGQPIRQLEVQDAEGNPLSVRDVFVQEDPQDDTKQA